MTRREGAMYLTAGMIFGVILFLAVVVFNFFMCR